MDWLNLAITVGSVVVGIALAWGALKTSIAKEFGTFDTRMAVMENLLNKAVDNHLAHIQASMEKIADKLDKDAERITRLEEQLKKYS